MKIQQKKKLLTLCLTFRTYEGGRIDLDEVIRTFKQDDQVHKYVVFEVINRSNSRKDVFSSHPSTPNAVGSRKARQATTMVELKAVSKEIPRSFGINIRHLVEENKQEVNQT